MFSVKANSFFEVNDPATLTQGPKLITSDSRLGPLLRKMGINFSGHGSTIVLPHFGHCSFNLAALPHRSGAAQRSKAAGASPLCGTAGLNRASLLLTASRPLDGRQPSAPQGAETRLGLRPTAPVLFSGLPR